jgi:hypothetical protein
VGNSATTGAYRVEVLGPIADSSIDLVPALADDDFFILLTGVQAAQPGSANLRRMGSGPNRLIAPMTAVVSAHISE